jgi:hypothetical protein
VKIMRLGEVGVQFDIFVDVRQDSFERDESGVGCSIG